MTGLKSAITKITLLEFALSYSRIYVDFLQRFMADFKPVMFLFDMVFVHVFRCLIFKVQPRSTGAFLRPFL